MTQLIVYKFSDVNNTYEKVKTEIVTNEVFENIAKKIPVGSDYKMWRFDLYKNGLFQGTIYSRGNFDFLIYMAAS